MSGRRRADDEVPVGAGRGAGLGEVLVSARSFAEYAAMLDLSDADLAGRVLDCPGGAAGFTATALQQGIDATAVDPAYAGGPAELAALAERAGQEAHRGHQHVLRDVEQYLWSFFTDPGDHLHQRLATTEVFAAGVAARPERYVPAALPHLPFADAAFDLTLCSHLLFAYDDRFDVAWHLAALVELARVADQVRVFPLLSHVDGARYPHLGELRAELARRGITSQVQQVAYEFQRGGDEMLVLHSPAPAAGDPGVAR